MPDQTKLLIRIRSPEGTKRFEVDNNEKVKKEFNINEECHLYLDQAKKRELSSSTKPFVNTYKIKNGDMLYIEAVGHTNASISTLSSSEPDTFEFPENKNLKEDEIDIKLSALDGRIIRPFSKFCHHSKNSKCIYCTPLEPYDENFMKTHEPPIKYMSFQTFLRKLMSGDKSKNVILENISCKIKQNCKEHKPWPKGICTKCQPNAITLTGQVYRHIDNIVFENGILVERYLDFWRKTGLQRAAFLYGHYTSPALDINSSAKNSTPDKSKQESDLLSTGPPPLSIQALVAAIYEPPQEDTRDSVIFNHISNSNNNSSKASTITSNSLDPEELESEKTVDYIADKLGLQRVGWIFTDLIPIKSKKEGKNDPKPSGKVKCLRNKDTYILSANECIMAANFQNQHPNVTKLSPENVFGSKFVTVVVTGDENESIHFEGYQVSQQCCALVRDDCLIPTKDNPSYAFVKPSTNTQYVPDVFYKEKNDYGNEVIKHAGPFPVEYLIVNVPASHPLQPIHTFNRDPGIPPFPIENRIRYTDDNQTFYTFAHHVKPYLNIKIKLLEALNDFHLLIYLANMDILPMKDDMDKLLLSLKNRDIHLFEEWCQSDNWLTLQKLIEMEGPALSPTAPTTSHEYNSAHHTKPFHENFHFSSHHNFYDTSTTSDASPITGDISSVASTSVISGPRGVHNFSSIPSLSRQDFIRTGVGNTRPLDIVEIDSDSEDPDYLPGNRTIRGDGSICNTSSTTSTSANTAPQLPQWTCKHCTFLNEKNNKVQGCEVCGLPEE